VSGVQDPLASTKLRAVKIAHTVIWAIFAACVLAIPVASSLGYFRTAALLGAIVFGEVVVLLINAWSCPLTAVAARYTQDRSPNFDIDLPQWLARNNKTLFGALYVLGGVVAAVQWVYARG
jgi:polyferredoxin